MAKILLVVSALLAFPLRSTLCGLKFSDLRAISRVFRFTTSGICGVGCTVLVTTFLNRVFGFAVEVIIKVLNS